MYPGIGPRALVDLGWSVIALELARRCRTSRAEALAAALEPDLPRDEAERRIILAAEIRLLMDAEITLSFAGITDVDTALARAQKGGVLSDAELVAVAGQCRGVTRLRKTILAHADVAPHLAHAAAELADLSGVAAPIDRSYDDGGRLSDHASDDLGRLRREALRLGDHLRSRMDSMVGELGDALQDSYFTQRGERYVVPVRVSARSRVSGIVHGTSQSGQTVFVEPAEIVDIGNRLTLAQCAVADEEERIRAVLSRGVAQNADVIISAGDCATYVDLVHATAALAQFTDACVPQVSRTGRLWLQAARHPHLVFAGKPCVANDIEVAARTLLIVSGPNAGGKTVALKTAGLAVLMMRAGLHVLAAEAELPWFDTVLTDIGDAQSLEQDLSTFSGHLVNLERCLKEAGARTLILIDEIAVGTEPEQGAALAQAVLERLAELGASAIITTHYERLKEAAAVHPQMANASVGFDMARLRPTFELHLGVPGSSGALLVARQLGLDGAVIERAEGLLGQERTRVEELLLEVSGERDRLAAERERLQEAIEDADRERARAEIARSEARAAEKRAHERAHGDAVAALREARVELERARQAARASASDARQIERNIDRAARSIRQSSPRRDEEGAPLSADALVPGASVWVSTLGQVGEVLSVPERGGVQVQVGLMKTVVALEHLREARSGGGARNKSRKQGASAQAFRAAEDAATRTEDATLDLRGARVDEALEAVDRFIDDSLLAEREAVFIIHGHGTGVLRKAVRAHVRSHKGVSTFRAGEQGEGGDGVTVAFLR